MLFKTLIASAALGSALLMPAFADDKRNDTTPERQQWLSIAQIAARLEAAGYRKIEKIEREGGGYEARATNQAGERTKLYINPQTGALISHTAKLARAVQPIVQAARTAPIATNAAVATTCPPNRQHPLQPSSSRIRWPVA